ncbi:MAG: response regulator [Alphaproteobacteria bacterium]
MGYALDRMTVLVAEDNEHVMGLVKLTLHAFGVRKILYAEDGAEAYRLLKSRDVDLVLTDFEMQPLGGLELLDLVRQSTDSPNPQLPVIVITGHTALDQITLARDHGATEILAKPFTPAGLRQRLITAIDHPRPFIDLATYFGPDRRRRMDLEYSGVERRHHTPHEIFATGPVHRSA